VATLEVVVQPNTDARPVLLQLLAIHPPRLPLAKQIERVTTGALMKPKIDGKVQVSQDKTPYAYNACSPYLNLLKMTATISKTRIVIIAIVITRFVAIL
jgi:hypothetical protein